MSEIIALPGRGYDYIQYNFGPIGLIVAGVMLVVAIVSLFIWMDRRK